MSVNPWVWVRYMSQVWKVTQYFPNRPILCPIPDIPLLITILLSPSSSFTGSHPLSLLLHILVISLPFFPSLPPSFAIASPRPYIFTTPTSPYHRSLSLLFLNAASSSIIHFLYYFFHSSSSLILSNVLLTTT